MKKLDIYLDHAATTPILPHILESLIIDLKEEYANPASAHAWGKKLSHRLDDCRQAFKKYFKADGQDQIIFTASATESNNMAIKGRNWKENDFLFYTESDHASVVETVKSQKVNKKNYAILANGEIDADSLLTSLSHEMQGMIVLTWVNNQSGAIQPIENLVRQIKLKAPHLHVHVDAVQALGKLTINVEGIDSLAFSGHKFGGPKGVGGLFLRHGVKSNVLLEGGGQEFGLRSSTQNYPAVHAMTMALHYQLEHIQKHHEQYLEFKKQLMNGLHKIDSKIQFPFAEKSLNILCLVIPGLSSDILLRHLEDRGIAASSTSACSSRIDGFNSVLAALNISEKDHKSVLRLSFGASTTASELDHFLKTYQEIWDEIGFLVKRK